jgi:ribosomal-protein-alanine N-acetyltransferase
MNCQTDRLSIRPYELGDYDCWIESFTGRLPALNRHDHGPIDIGRYPRSWFEKHIAKHQELAAKDDTYHFGVFGKEEINHYGHVEIHIVKRETY